MPITYTGTLATDLDKLRFYIGDTTDGTGPKPDGTNFSDTELTGLLTIEGSVQRAIAAVYETLATMWAVEVDITVGPRREALSQAAERYASLAAMQRSKYGSAASVMRSRVVTRTDGYSDDLDATET